MADQLDMWTSSAEGSPARQSASPASDSAKTTTDGCGPTCSESWAKLVPGGYWSRMSSGYCQLTLDGSWAECSENWPRSGFVAAGIAYRQPPLEPRISAIGSGYLPTITQPYGNNVGGAAGRVGKVRHSLHSMARNNLWPTVTKGDAKASGSRNHEGSNAHAGVSLTDAVRYGNSSTKREGKGGLLSPTWIEWFLGLPSRWTDLKLSATASSLLSPRSTDE